MPALFMDRLPSNFEANDDLSAIASLIASDSEDDDDVKMLEPAGKATRSGKHRRQSRQNKTPYKRPTRSSVRDLQVFMSLATVKSTEDSN